MECRKDLNGCVRVAENKDTRIPDASVFTIEREDHTVANALRAYILKDRRTVFCGYRVPHPLEHNCEIKLQTVPEETPKLVFMDGLDAVVRDCESLISQIDVVRRFLD